MSHSAPASNVSPALASREGAEGAQALLGTYQPPRGAFDEMLKPDGGLRGHWQRFTASIAALGAEEFSRRWRQAQRVMHENGIAYSAYGDPSDKPRPWELDPLPLLVPAAQWLEVSHALQQRAHLFNTVLADLYGPQDLLHRGLLPRDALYRHPDFRRPLHGLHVPGDRYLTLYAADIARSPDGQWWVLGDRTEAPSGSGFALENRLVTSRMLPDAFHHCHVERLAPYFMALQESVRRQATRRVGSPRVALLSQGPKSSNYFEDAYLARYLGFTLAEGDDLTVRNNRVMLKTLEGLIPLDVILRRPNTDDCDPLELAETSKSGAAGMVHAARSGHIAMVNALGSGLVESPLFMAFLPRLCKALLGEELKMPGVATWWCGEPKSLTHVLANLDTLIVRPAFRRRGRELEQSKRLVELSREQLIETIEADPTAYVAQERVLRSTMPVWTQNGNGNGGEPKLESSHIAVRAFAVATDDSYYVMNGGLARVAHSADPLFISLLAGEGSKDVWVLADKPVEPVTLLDTKGGAVKLRRSGAELPSRVADHVFWLGRNLERADAAARLLRTIGLRITAETYSSEMLEVPALLRVMAEQGQLEPGYVVAGIREQMPAIEDGLPKSVFDESQSGSLRSIVSQVFQTASVVRDRISIDCWRIVKRLDEQFRPAATGVTLSDLLAMIDTVLIDLAAFSGLAMESMTRTYTWRFLDLGRRLERALHTTSLLKYSLADPQHVQTPLLEALLEISDSLMTYRSRYLANLQLAPLLDLLITDETNPRSVAYQLERITNHVNALPRDTAQPGYSNQQRLAMSALHSIRMLNVETLAEIHNMGANHQLLRFLEGLELRLPEISDAVSQRYLTHAGQVRQLADLPA